MAKLGNEGTGEINMSESEALCSIRDCARAVIEAIAQDPTDISRLRAGLLEAAGPFIRRPDLYSLGVKRPGNHIDNSKYIYYDGDLSITLDQLPQGMVVPPHDHGVWEALTILKGRLRHVVYDRRDDGTVEEYADLETIEDRIYTPGELAMVMPPAEIHSFTALEAETFIFTIVGGNYKPTRHYYNVDKKSYVVATAGNQPKADAA
jgi:predicted metal-dependent enzyme (double-stranded beta helix superfamily)